MEIQEFKVVKVRVGRLEVGEDLYQSIEEYCVKNNIRQAWVNALGAVSRLAYFYYDQTKKSYIQAHIDQKLEIVSCMGNISLKEGKPFAHLHLACSDSEGRTVGGHLTPGTKVFACEIIFILLEGEGQ
ncbi:MAG TPA: PPC domain-containing DNA-binding protein, partial [bacterium]|nr:PPC domain-containing DNA-binding protein [bacterium]